MVGGSQSGIVGNKYRCASGVVGATSEVGVEGDCCGLTTLGSDAATTLGSGALGGRKWVVEFFGFTLGNGGMGFPGQSKPKRIARASSCVKDGWLAMGFDGLSMVVVLQ